MPTKKRLKRAFYAGASLVALLSFWFPTKAPKPGSRYSDTYACRAYQYITSPFNEAYDIRNNIHKKMGLTGKGTTIRCIDRALWHVTGVKSAIQSSWHGVAPDAKVETVINEKMHFNDTSHNLFDPKRGAECLKWLADEIKKAVADKTSGRSPQLRVLNASLSIPKVLAYLDAYHKLQAKNPDALACIYPHQDVSILDKKTTGEIFKDIFQRVDQLYAEDPDWNAALKEYHQACDQLPLANLILVVSAGNNHHKIDPQYPLPDSSELTIYGQHPNVIVAAAASHSGYNREKATLQNFSSHGGHLWKPTVAAPGAWGTSFAAPRIAGYIALMLEKNPNLTTTEIIQLIRQTAIDTEAPEIAEGAGMVDPIRLLEATPPANPKK